MILRSSILTLVLSAGTVPPSPDSASLSEKLDLSPYLLQIQARRSCQAVSTCREAVIMWCDGYTRADADDDGIPCENVCRTLAEVDEIRAEIGC